jgi:hypothetical protein
MPDDLSTLVSKRLANFELGADAIDRLIERVTIEGLKIGRINPCIYGICVDYWTTEFPDIRPEMHIGRRISKWEVFPYGVLPEWDMFHVRVAYEMDELEGKVAQRELGL